MFVVGLGGKKGGQALLERCLVATVQKCSSFYTSYGVGRVIKVGGQIKTQWLGLKSIQRHPLFPLNSRPDSSLA